MSFFARLRSQGEQIDLVFIDGDHDFEFANFDLRMAASLLRPGGVIVLDDVDQSGPYTAARLFLRDNPEWTELGSALDSYVGSAPFAAIPSIKGTTLMVLRSPEDIVVRETPLSWGQRYTSMAGVSSIRLALAAAPTPGTVHYRVILRSFSRRTDRANEEKCVGSFQLTETSPLQIAAPLQTPLQSRMPSSEDPIYSVETELSWQSARALRLAERPTLF